MAVCHLSATHRQMSFLLSHSNLLDLPLIVYPSQFGFGLWGDFSNAIFISNRSELRSLILIFFENFKFLSEREYQRGDEVSWYPDGEKIVRSEYSPATFYAFGNLFY